MSPKKKEGAPVAGTASCTQCRHTFRYMAPPNAPAPSTCGALVCRALHGWTPEEWEGRARMAHARADAGLELGQLDRIALRQVGADA